MEIAERMVNAFIFLANEVITGNGFFFDKNTFVYGQSIKTFSTVAFIEQKLAGETEIKLRGKLKDEVFNALKDCLKNSDAVRKNFKKYL